MPSAHAAKLLLASAAAALALAACGSTTRVGRQGVLDDDSLGAHGTLSVIR